MVIIVDDRERAGGLADALARAGVRASVARLAVGDVRIGGVEPGDAPCDGQTREAARGDALLVERKSAADFVASVLEGRLERQAQALLCAAPAAVLIVEGEFTARALAGMAAGELRRAMLRVQLDWRLPLVRSRDIDDTARWIAALAEREHARGGGAGRPAQDDGALAFAPGGAARPGRAADAAIRGIRLGRAGRPAGSQRGKRPKSPEAGLARELLMARVAGLGVRRAAALLARFGTVHGVAAATDRELQSVEGIGPALAQVIREAFGGR